MIPMNESKLELLHTLSMDTHSNSDDQFIKEELHEAPPTRKALPYQSLLDELHTLCGGIFGTFRSKISLSPCLQHEIRILQGELMLQQMVFMLLQNHGFMFEALDNIQSIAETDAVPIKEVVAGLNANQAFAARSFYFDKWKSGVRKFLKTVYQKIKPRLKEFCLGIVDRLLQGNSSKEYDISSFIYIILLKLKDLENLKPNMIAPIKKQMKTLIVILNFACMIAGNETNLDEKLENFLLYFGPWVNIAAALVILYWVDENDEELFVVVSPSLHKFNLSILELVEAYIVGLKALKPSNVSEVLVMREAVGRFNDMVQENLIVSTDARFEMLIEGLTLWIALLMDPPQGYAEGEKLICAQTNRLVEKAEASICSLCLDKLGEDSAERRNILLNDFLENMNKAKAELKQLHVEIPGLSWNNAPQTNRKGFFDFLLENLLKKLEFEANLFPFEKHLIAIAHKELSLLRPFLMDIFELQDEHKELRDIWVQASNLAYHVDYVTDCCLSSIDVPTWANLMHLSKAIEEIQKLNYIRKNDQICNKRVINTKLNSRLVLPGQEEVNATTEDDVKVVFTQEEHRIIDRLIGGEVRLDFVAIVGMPGQGKTTLAHRVFQNPGEKHNFNKCAWAWVSQAYDTKEILRDILKNVGEPVSPEEFPCVTQEDLADRLRKRLKGRRYLVVLDDMWDAKAWHELKLSFPDDNNGSRILLTSRNHNVALEVKSDCCIVELHPLSYEESWNLLQVKVFEEACCPPTLSDIGMTIAKNCKGLPLAIVVAAGLLKKDKSVDSWKQTSESLKSQIASEGCMDILDLSYKHLPDCLRQCFLYLGAFQEDRTIDAKTLIQLWIAEGFVKNDGMKSMEDVANQYLIDLVSRSLVFISQRSSRNGIKECHVHDLLHELCLIKAKEERFLLVPNRFDHLSRMRNNHYRLCVHEKWQFFVDSERNVPGARSLLVSCHSFYLPSSPSFWERFKLLRVLDLRHIFVRETDFDEITQFIHLRFMSVTCKFSIPSSIVNLFRLEVLHLRYVGINKVLPSAVMKMANLRHVFASRCRIECTEDFDKLKLKLCPQLTNLETLTSLHFFKESSFEWVAQKVPNILKLDLALSFCVHLSGYFKKLESLKLYILGSRKMAKGISPSIFDFPLTLKKLTLKTRPQLASAMISFIGKLSNLEVLKLEARFKDKKWDVKDDEFLKLKYLEIKFSSIEEWNISDESFPCIEQLVVRGCPKLGELPSRFGAITTLKRIEVHYCSNRITNSFQQIVDDQMDSGNKGLQFSISGIDP